MRNCYNQAPLGKKTQPITSIQHIVWLKEARHIMASNVQVRMVDEKGSCHIAIISRTTSMRILFHGTSKLFFINFDLINPEGLLEWLLFYINIDNQPNAGHSYHHFINN